MHEKKPAIEIAGATTNHIPVKHIKQNPLSIFTIGPSAHIAIDLDQEKRRSAGP